MSRSIKFLAVPFSAVAAAYLGELVALLGGVGGHVDALEAEATCMGEYRWPF